jgi:hypothetical protein
VLLAQIIKKNLLNVIADVLIVITAFVPLKDTKFQNQGQIKEYLDRE